MIINFCAIFLCCCCCCMVQKFTTNTHTSGMGRHGCRPVHVGGEISPFYLIKINFMSSCEKVFSVLRWRSRPGDDDNELDAAKRDAPKARQFPAWCAEESVSQFDFVRSLLVTLSGSYSFWCMCGAHYCALSGRSQLVRKEFEMYFRTSESSQWEKKKKTSRKQVRW